MSEKTLVLELTFRRVVTAVHLIESPPECQRHDPSDQNTRVMDLTFRALVVTVVSRVLNVRENARLGADIQESGYCCSPYREPP